MFQCIIQQRIGWMHSPPVDAKDIYPGRERERKMAEKDRLLVFLNTL